MSASQLKKVAIACQGGGTHAAFEAGVLTEILERLKPGKKPGFELIGLSGTSAGALCALTVWYGLSPKKNGPKGSPEEAIKNLNDFWDAFAARTPAEIMQNGFAQFVLTAQEQEVPVLGINMPIFGLNPRGLASHALIAEMLQMGVRKEYLDFRAMLHVACPDLENVDWDTLPVRLMLGASEIVHGIETVFDSDCRSVARDIRHTDPSIPNRWRTRLPLTWKGAAASGTLPGVREAQEINGGYYWDGLYSQNPPIREFLSGVKAEYVPNEIWVIRINPQQCDRPPTTNAEIQDRENELIGNLSLNKELDFILIINELIKTYAQTPRLEKTGTANPKEKEHPNVAEDYKPVVVRTIKMKKETAAELRTASKFDRSRAFIDRLRDEGRDEAGKWLDDWPNVGCYPEDVAYRMTPPGLIKKGP